MRDPRDIVAAMRSDLAGEECYGGLDLASVKDLAALGLIFPRKDCWPALCRFWIPEEQVKEATHRDQVPYDVWVDQGWIETTPGRVIDFDWIRAAVMEWATEFDLLQLAFDPWRAQETALRLSDEGIVMVECRQGYKTMSEASKKFEALVLEHRLAHGGNPVLRMMAENVSVVQDPAGNIKPEKDDKRGRIDGIVALVMATWRAMLAEKKERQSVYETWDTEPDEDLVAVVEGGAPVEQYTRKHRASVWETWGES